MQEMKNNKKVVSSLGWYIYLLILAGLVQACKEKDIEVAPADTITEQTAKETYGDSTFVAADWTSTTHSKKGTPNFSLVFDDTKVQRIDLVITKNRWQLMLADMTSKYGSFGSSGGPGGGQVGGGLTVTENPLFVPAEVFYNGKQWYRVGVRFKGNSSLQSAWKSGNYKLSFKLDFDEFEDTYKQIDNQRFNGFKKLSLKNNFNDKSLLREKVAGDIFMSEGMASSHTAFYALYVDFGDGPTYFGVYTLTEEVDDTVITTQFSSDKGNLYQPDGSAASFAVGSFNTSQLVKENNEDAADYSDVQALYTVLHDATRTTDAPAWRTKLDNVFDTDVFLHYLATNTVIQNWDTYGRMTHNYFLYTNPDTKKLTWIPWDNNEALQTGNQGGSLPLDFGGLSASQWPLIGYLYQDPVYQAKYKAYVQKVANGTFNVAKMQALYTSYALMVEPYAAIEKRGYSFLTSASDFTTAINTLKTHVASRQTAVNTYLK
jgi:spore coat protein H